MILDFVLCKRISIFELQWWDFLSQQCQVQLLSRNMSVQKPQLTLLVCYWATIIWRDFNRINKSLRCSFVVKKQASKDNIRLLTFLPWQITGFRDTFFCSRAIESWANIWKSTHETRSKDPVCNSRDLLLIVCVSCSHPVLSVYFHRTFLFRKTHFTPPNILTVKSPI